MCLPMQLVNFQPPFILSAALYNQLNVIYPGNTALVNNISTTWLAAATRPNQADKAFLILPVRVPRLTQK